MISFCQISKDSFWLISYIPVDDSVESVDGISGVSDGSNSTVRLNKRVLSLHDISVSGFMVRVLVSSKSILDRVSEVVLWVWVVWLSSDGY
jgi:hypothetical protein